MKYTIGFAILMALFSGCNNDVIESPMSPSGNEDFTIWSGAAITFEKSERSDPREEVNQDRITDKVWITRGLHGSIYNAVSQFNGTDNPNGTEWAFGTTAEVADLTFRGFKDTHGSNTPSVLDQDMVLHLIEEDVYIDIQFTSWSRRKGGGEGGFSYVRSTP